MLEREEERAPLLDGAAPCHYTEENVRPQPPHSKPWLLGSFLAIFSGILFTANNFLVKYYTIEAVDMLMVRSCLQTILTALVISKKTPDSSDLILHFQFGPRNPSCRARGWPRCWWWCRG